MLRQLLQYFETLEQYPGQRMALLIAGMLFFWILEGAIPLYKLKFEKNRFSHAGINLVFTLIHLAIHSLLAFLIVVLSEWCRLNGFGLVYWANANIFF
ncbi:MAG: sterol desaturase family protein, partial [Ferruginibacter sp.]